MDARTGSNLGIMVRPTHPTTSHIFLEPETTFFPSRGILIISSCPRTECLILSDIRRSPPMPTNAPLNRKLRMGLVGGGQGAFIGRVHATAAVMDNRAVLVAGALSSDPAKAKASAPDYDIPHDRAYGSYKEMAEAEKKRPDPVDFVSVA